MTEEIDAIMFDLGGTLIHLEPTNDIVFHRALENHGHHSPLAEVAKAIAAADRRFDEESANLDGVHEDRYWKRYDKFVLDMLEFRGDRSKFASDVSSEFERIVPKVESWVEYPDSRPVLDELRKTDLKIGLISNATDLARKVMDHLGLTRYFDPLVISSEVGARKPDSKIFQLAANLARIPLNRIIYIGDKFAVDVVGARAAGMNSVLVDRGDIYPDVDCLRVRNLEELRRFL